MSGAARAAALAVAAGLLAPAAAGATTRYVRPDGADTGPCTALAPCSLAWAVNGEGSEPGDEILLAPGAYVDQPLVVGRPLTITARADRPAPVLRVTQPGAVALTVAEAAVDTVVEHLALDAAGDGAAGADVQAAATLRDLTVATAGGPCLRSAAAGVRLLDATLTLDGSSGAPCLETTGSDTLWRTVRVRARRAAIAAVYEGNGTITDLVAAGRRTGLAVGGEAAVHRVTATGRRTGIALGGTVALSDSVAVARGADGAAVRSEEGRHRLVNVTAWATGAGSAGLRADGGAQLDVVNAIARGREADLRPDALAGSGIRVEHSNWRTGTWGVEDGGANQSGPPRFADAAGDDFRLRPGSPAVDAGSFGYDTTSTDRAGRFRWLGARPDIGAYERPAPRPVRRADTRRPRLGVVRLLASRFRARGVGRGTRLLVVVSEDADLVGIVDRAGRRRFTGAVVLPLARGTNRVRITGRVEGRTLPPGRYRLTVFARDVAQNLSRPRVLTFVVAR